MRQRLLVMNGQRLVQEAQGDQWLTVKVEKAGSIKPGIYNVHSAVDADKNKAYEGAIVHADGRFIYQAAGKSLVRHSIDQFDTVPELGSSLKITNDSGTLTIVAASIKRGRSMG